MYKEEKYFDAGNEKRDPNIIHTYIDAIEKARRSSLVAVGIFHAVSSDSALLAEWIKNDVIARTNLPLRAAEEMRAYETSL